jgi:hypothetical protein
MLPAAVCPEAHAGTPNSAAMKTIRVQPRLIWVSSYELNEGEYRLEAASPCSAVRHMSALDDMALHRRSSRSDL